MPVIPPTPWQANTSRHHQFSFRKLLTELLTILLNIPMNACGILTNPAAGVIATNPTTVPIKLPSLKVCVQDFI
jgi:hypothetical protein